MPLSVAGFPKDPEDYLYCYPQLSDEPPTEVKETVNKAFNNFESLVYSDGIY